MRREEIKQFLLELAAHTPPEDQAGAHLSDVLQVPDLMHMIMRDFECRRHNLRPGETPNLKVLAMRYGRTDRSLWNSRRVNERKEQGERHKHTHYHPGGSIGGPCGCRIGSGLRIASAKNL